MDKYTPAIHLCVFATMAFLGGMATGMPILLAVGFALVAAAIFFVGYTFGKGRGGRRTAPNPRASSSAQKPGKQLKGEAAGNANAPASPSEPQPAGPSKPQTKQPTPRQTSEPQPEKPQVDVTFRLSDLKTGIAGEPLDSHADPMVVDYERYARFFAHRRLDDFWLSPAMKAVPAPDDHMSSPLIKPTGDVARDEQTALLEIMKYLWGNRQQLVRAGNKMDPLDFRDTIKVFPGYLEYTYDTYSAWDSGCYDSGAHEPGSYYTATRHITVYLDSEEDYKRERKRACDGGRTYADVMEFLGYDGSLAFEDETEAFIRDSWDTHTLYLRKPFNMKSCLRIAVRFRN